MWGLSSMGQKALGLDVPFTALSRPVFGDGPQVFSKAELELIARLCQQHDVLCITDEVYQWLVFDGHQHISIGEPGWPGCPHSPGYLCQGIEPNLGVSSRPDD